jgi:NADH-quinone oxidoreductase subunit N
MLFMNYLSIMSEYYLSFIFFFVFLLGTFSSLSEKKFFPNYYSGICYLTIISLSNVLFLDVWNRIEYNNSYDIYKNTGDVYFKILLTLLSILFIIYSLFYIYKSKFNDFEYIIIIFFTLLSFNFFVLSIDIISFYLLLEIQSLSLYILTAFNKKNQYSVESGLKYFILSSFSSVILLFGFSYVYGTTGSLNITEINFFFYQIDRYNSTFIIYLISSVLIFSAFFFKLYVAPFHLWISDIYQGAPTSSTAFFGTITSLPIFYLWSKYYYSFFYIIEHHIFYVILTGSMLSMILGAIGALYQKKIKRLIAFSSVSNIGYVLLGFLEENIISLSNSFTYFVTYIISSMGLFAVFMNIYSKKNNFFIERFSLLSGMITRNRLSSIILIVFLFTAAGVPPFSLFFAKILFLTNLSYQGYSILLFIVVITSVIGSFYYVRVIKIISFDISTTMFISTSPFINNYIISLLVLFQLSWVFNSEYVTVVTEYLVLCL